MGAVSVPAPSGGWNARDAMDKMDAMDAIKLVNWVPRAGYVESRAGCQLHVEGLGGTVETIIPYRGATADKMLAAANSNIWDVTTTGAPSSIKSALTSDVWEHDHHSNVVIMVNGVDVPQVYNGTTITNIVVTGVTDTTLWGINNFKGRMYYWKQNDQSFWYAAANSYQGALTQFDLSRVAGSGGNLVQMITWTLDSGKGVDDLAAFVFSTGEVIVYQGSDPADANDWSMIGKFSIGEPISIRAHAQVGGTEIIASKDGYLDIGVALKGGRYSEDSSYSSKIIRAAKDAAIQYSGNTGWDCLLYPAGNLFIVNVPLSSTQSIQHVRDTTNGGWAKFTNWNARSFGVHDDKLYFGDASGNIFLADVGITDNALPIELEAVPAFNPLGSRTQKKLLTSESVVSSYITPSFWALDGLADFNTTTRSTIQTDTVPGGGASDWDTSPWDTTDWASPTFLSDASAQPRAWRNVSSTGYTLTSSIRLNTVSQRIIWFSTAYIFKNAGAI